METWDTTVASYDASDKMTFETEEVNRFRFNSNPFQNSSSQVNDSIFI